jgi:transposase
MLAGENVSALSRALRVRRKDLYVWRQRFRAGGPSALRGRGRPRKIDTVGPAASAKTTKTKAAAVTQPGEIGAARKRIAELERKIGQQQVDLDFFQQALRQVRGSRRPSAELGVPASTKSSKR